MMRILSFLCLISASNAWVELPSSAARLGTLPSTSTNLKTKLSLKPTYHHSDGLETASTQPTPILQQLLSPHLQNLDRFTKSTLVALALGVSTVATLPSLPAHATDSKAIVTCLFKKCALPLGKCIANPKCLLNVACINTCNGRPDEIDCQIECGNLFENEVVGEFNKCAVSDMSCVPQQQDDGSYPVPSDDQVVPKFDTKLFEGRLYITAGQNPLFDIFPCQVHFFTQPEPGRFIGKLNWRVSEPDGEFFTRDAVQEFVQDPKQPSHLINHDNEYLHYKDDWWIIDYEQDNNPDKVPPFAFVYYRGSNDAWDGYGGVVVYTRDAALPESLIPRLREASKKVGFDFDKDFVITDNTCPPDMSEGEKVLLREKFAGKAFLQTEEQVQAQATLLRGNAVNSVKAQKIFIDGRLSQAEKALEVLEERTKEFEAEVVKDVTQLEKEVVKDVLTIEKEIEKDVGKVEGVIEKDITQLEEEIVKEVKQLRK